MEITISQETGRVPIMVFHLNGELSAEEPLISSAESAHQQGMRDLILDMSAVPFVSSAGLRAIHHIYLLLHPDANEKSVHMGIVAGTYHAPHLKLAGPPKNAAKALQAAGYDMFLEICKNEADAIASF
jgi:hypothetical protein